MHAVEELDHAGEARRDIDFVRDVGAVRRNDGNAEHKVEAGCENDKPQQGPDEGGDEAAALVKPALSLAADDAGEAVPVLNGAGVVHAASFRVRLSNASFMLGAAVLLRTASRVPSARMRPPWRTMILVSPSASSMRWVAQRTPRLLDEQRWWT